MKSNLMLKKFSTNPVPGTMNQKELKTFFGGKVLYTESKIYINDDSINFSQVISPYNNGYQYFDAETIPDDWETKFSENLSDLKMNNHSISKLSQTTANLTNNTRWQISINGTSILRDYLFFRIKEQRAFRMINAIETYSNNINNSIYDYINFNLLVRYRLEQINFYVSYYDIKQQTIQNTILLQYNPKFDVSVYDKSNLTNIGIVNFDPWRFDQVVVYYYQSKPSNQYGFNYYFDLIFSSENYRQKIFVTASQAQTLIANNTASAL